MAYLVYSHIELIRIAGNFLVRMEKQDFYDDEFSLFSPVCQVTKKIFFLVGVL